MTRVSRSAGTRSADRREATVRHESGGIALRTETVGLDEWSRRLAAALGTYAERNAAAAEALSRFTLPGPT